MVWKSIKQCILKRKPLYKLFIVYWWSTPGRQQGRKVFICYFIFLTNSRPFVKHVYKRKQTVKWNMLMFKSLIPTKYTFLFKHTFGSHFCMNEWRNKSIIKHGWEEPLYSKSVILNSLKTLTVSTILCPIWMY